MIQFILFRKERKRRVNLKGLFFFFPVLFTFCISSDVFGQDNEFDGLWIVDASKSTFSNTTSDAAPKEIQVRTSKDSIIVEKRFVKLNGTKSSTLNTLSLDGKFVESTISTNTRRLVSLNSSHDGSVLIINSHSFVTENGLKYEYMSIETMKIYEDGKTLTVQKRTLIPDRTEAFTAIYTRR